MFGVKIFFIIFAPKFCEIGPERFSERLKQPLENSPFEGRQSSH